MVRLEAEGAGIKMGGLDARPSRGDRLGDAGKEWTWGGEGFDNVVGVGKWQAARTMRSNVPCPCGDKMKCRCAPAADTWTCMGDSEWTAALDRRMDMYHELAVAPPPATAFRGCIGRGGHMVPWVWRCRKPC